MLNRWIGIIAAAAMVLANAAIFSRDILPRWLAEDAPPSDVGTLAPGEERFTHVGIYHEREGCIGRSWTRAERQAIGGMVSVTTTTVLERIHLPVGITTPPVRIETRLLYRPDQSWIDDLDFRMYGMGIPISLVGAAYPTGEFACTWQVGPQRGDFLLEAGAPAMLGDVIRPFDRLPNLYVGRTWQVKLVDPLSQILPNMKETGLGMEPTVIQVVREETIEHGGKEVKTYVVEGAGARAYVADDGAVLRQEVTLPLLGRLVLLDEPYDEDLLRSAQRAVPNDWDVEFE